MSTLKALHGFVSGRVQGVFFRGETQKKAKLLGLAGWVKNTTDGQVEVFIAGQQVSVVTMVEWLQTGPTMARVETVQLDEVDWEVPQEFTIIR